MIPEYKPDHFTMKELVPREMYETVSLRRYILWNIFDHRILITIDRLRKAYGKMIANTWAWGGRNQYRGYRPKECSVGSVFSQHRFGRAADLVPVEESVDKIRQDILREPEKEEFEYITAIELNVPWLHVDCRSHLKAVHGILTFKP